MPLTPLHTESTYFIDSHGRQIILRGLNLGGDSKVPWPDGGTQHVTDFADHRDVSFVGRPFLLSEADQHFNRFDEANAAHVMQHRFDYESDSHAQESYPPMSWASNYRMPANAIMWTLF